MKLKRIKGTLGSMRRIEACPELLREALIADLSFNNPAYANAKRFSPWENTNIPEKVCLLEDYGDYVQLPRGYLPKRLSPQAMALWRLVKWEDCRVEFNVKFPRILLTPNEDQEHVSRIFKVMEKRKERPAGNYLFVAPTSMGKTISQALLAMETKQKTLVLCKTNLIKRAWQENLYQLFGMNEDDLGDIQRANFRLGEHFTLASIATLSRRKHLWQELFSQIGCLIIDESQIIAGPTILEICKACPAKYVIGMTATDHRRDGQMFLVNAILGQRALKIFNKQRETQSSLPLGNARLVRTQYQYLDAKGEPVSRDLIDFHELTDQMATSPARNAIVIEEVFADWEKGHSVLVVTPRVEHAKHLHEALLKRGIKQANLLTGETNANKFYTEKLLEAVMTRRCRCIIATIQAIKLGANLNPLDRLHVAIPPSNKEDLEQLIGRIRRKHPKKKDAELCYYHDIMTPYWHGKFKSVFVPVMRKLKVPRWQDVFIA